ncbi:MAG: YesL family protein [Lachnospiraceae bacterium]|nr:YesL family protein [Lachnospiraceae bacterium]
MKFFSVDSPLYKFMSRLMDIFKLNCMWLLCSIPIVTMGAATTAAYTITLKMVDDEEGYIAEPFWREFKANLKKGSITGVIILFACYAVYLDFQLYHAVKQHSIMFLIIGVVGIYLIFMHGVFAFPLLARYENSIINTMKNSYSIAAKFLGRTAFLAVLLAIEVIIILWNLTTMFAGLLIGPACIMLTISGFASSFFKVIERENLMADMEEKESAHLNGEPVSEDEKE